MGIVYKCIESSVVCVGLHKCLLFGYRVLKMLTLTSLNRIVGGRIRHLRRPPTSSVHMCDI